MLEKTSLLFASSFTDACAPLSNKIKSKVINTSNKFNNAPSLVGLNLERVNNSADKDIFSIRVDENYRIICKRPDSKLVFFLYVDTHDKAYKWAETHKCEIGGNGAISVFDSVPNKTQTDSKGQKKAVSPLSVINDEVFSHIKIPHEYRDTLRTKVFTKNQLVGFKKYISEESYYFLEQILSGMSIESELDVYDQLTSEVIIPSILSPIFGEYTDEDLLRIGIPAEYLDIVKSIKSDDELQGIQKKLPEPAVQNLYALKAGESINVVIRRASAGSKHVEETDFKTAMENSNSKQTVVKVDTDSLITELITMPMEKWRVYLHPDQRNTIERQYNGPARVIGGAGTGKTVIIVHRAKHLASLLGPDARILVTTYNKTLADDIRKRLGMICSENELAKITVKNIDSLISETIRKFNKSLMYDSTGRNGFNPVQDAWERAIQAAKIEGKYDIPFLIDEWRYVIQAQFIRNKADYLNASRRGRGTRLSPRAREDVWQIFEQYNSAINRSGRMDIDAAENYCVSLLNQHPELRFNSVLVDECQDLKAPAIRAMRAFAGVEHPNDVFFAGDSRQRIYGATVPLSQCGVKVNNRSSVLRMNYRTTFEISEAAKKIQQNYSYDDLDGDLSDNDDTICILHGEKPTFHGFVSLSVEMEAVVKDIKKRIGQGFNINEMCVTVRRTKLISKVKHILESNGIPCLQLASYQNDDKSIPGVRIATMHRVKGMEFECMYVVAVSNDIMPPPEEVVASPDDESVQELLKKEANILYVAMTRAKKVTWVSYSGKPSELLLES